MMNMVKLKCLGTGSTGYCYSLDDGENIILLDSGIPIKDIKIGIEFNVSGLKAIFVSHHHQDHSLAIKDLRSMGKRVYCPYSECVPQMVQVGKFKVQSFELTDLEGNPTHTNGDGSLCRVFGFLVSHPDMGRLLYITDTQYCKYKFSNINHILLGVNYSAEAILSDENEQKKYHVFNGHMELNTAKDFISALIENNNITNIILCHLSIDNADAQKFVNEIIEVTKGENVVVARKGLII